MGLEDRLDRFSPPSRAEQREPATRGPRPGWLARGGDLVARCLPEAFCRDIVTQLRHSDSVAGPGRVVSAAALFGGAGALGGFALAGIAGAAVLGTGGLATPFALLRFIGWYRRQLLEQDLPTSLVTIWLGVRGGLSLAQAMELVAREWRGPVGRLYRTVIHQSTMGRPLNVALERQLDELRTPDARRVIRALLIVLRKGGDVLEAYRVLGAEGEQPG